MRKLVLASTIALGACSTLPDFKHVFTPAPIAKPTTLEECDEDCQQRVKDYKTPARVPQVITAPKAKPQRIVKTPCISDACKRECVKTVGRPQWCVYHETPKSVFPDAPKPQS